MTTRLPPFDAALLSLSDYQLGLRAYAWWAVAQAEKLGISRDQVTPEIAEQLRVKALELDTNNENLAGLEKALQVVASGDLARGGMIFRRHMERQAVTIAAFDEAKTGRRRQRAIAKKPRIDALQGLIIEIMRHQPEIKQAEVLAELRKREGRGVIEDIADADNKIFFIDADGKGGYEAKVSGLKHRMTRARKKLSS